MNTNINITQLQQILNDRIKDDIFTTLKDMPKPHLFKDITKATKRIVKAIQQNETINNFELPQTIDITKYSEETLPNYQLPAVV